jgi:polar amino acid transport system permease protein
MNVSIPSSSSTRNTIAEATPLVQTRVTNRLADFPWWALILALMGVLLVYNFATNSTYQDIITYLVAGIRLTIIVTLVSFALSMIIGLITAFAQMSTGTNFLSIVVRNVATGYVQIIRGIPVIVLIFYTALVIVPAGINGLNTLGNWFVSMGWLEPDNSLSNMTSRGVSFVIRGIIALAINYGAFSAEVFRAGIQSIEKGQLEASRALGLNWGQMMRYVILPQAIRRILPPLGNDFISMLKESSLVSVLGVGEITQLGKKYSAASFLYPQTYNTVAFLYLSMTIILSMGVKYLERRMATGEEK